MKIAVLKGGSSSEREVSFHSAEKVIQGYRELGHDVLELDTVLPIEQLDREIEVTETHLENGECNLVELLRTEEVKSADFIFNSLHGGCGEDGRLQSVLSMLDYSYNGSGHEACNLSMDKVVSKLIFDRENIHTPRWLHFDKEKKRIEDIKYTIIKNFDFPVIIKPANEGSTVGLNLVREDNLHESIEEAMKYEGELLVEEFIEGRELTVGFIEGEPLPITEIKPEHKIFDYECKYTKGMSSYKVPAELDSRVAKNVKDLASEAYRALKCSGYGRIDLRLANNGTPYFLEMNTLPGMTDTSLVPMAAKAEGISFEELLEKILQAGLNN